MCELKPQLVVAGTKLNTFTLLYYTISLRTLIYYYIPYLLAECSDKEQEMYTTVSQHSS